MEEDIKNMLGPAIKFYRKRMGITQQEFTVLVYSRGIKIDRPMLTRIENQTRGLHDLEIFAICNILEVDSNDLFNYVSE
ncbi:helix-turn-helix domain-containing protein [Clostridium sp.]|jgi:transcriptional regulator with XRE-family HTH domain|uniref:helix-turn-helix domain-containing protein n=1 Tax=Clostridium sp. TaxID=1506 RepID=UPI003EEB4126